MTKRKDCKICGRYSAKRGVCERCKENFPYEASNEGMKPFNRLRLFLNKKEREERKRWE